MVPLVSAPNRAISRAGAHRADSVAAGPTGLLALFLVVLLLPISMDIGGQRMSPYRIFLIVLFVPFAARLLSGAVGKLTAVDGCMLGFVSWMALTLVYHHGLERFPYALIQAVELFGGYMLGRTQLRSAADYRRFIGYFLWALVILLPLAIYELLYSRMVLSDLLRSVFDVTKKNLEFRYGLSRVQVVFPHSILYGLFCSLALASVYYLYGKNLMRMVPRFVLVIVMTVMSLSSAPLLSIAMQMIMILWGKVTAGSWKLLAALTASAYLVLELFSNRGAVIIFIETLTFSPQSGWWRIHIWRHGTASVFNHPFMGIGLNDWVRPSWLTSSVDNFWLLTAMRHGLPGVIFLVLAFGLHIAYILRRRDLSPDAQLVRRGYVITIVGLLFVLSTVHIWNEVAVFVMFFMGAGAFLYTAAPADEPSDAATAEMLPASGGRALPLTRFPQSSGSALQEEGQQRGQTLGIAKAPMPKAVSK